MEDNRIEWLGFITDNGEREELYITYYDVDRAFDGAAQSKGRGIWRVWDRIRMIMGQAGMSFV